MENNALISVIIPVYNVEQYLRQCIDSVLHQTYQNIEVILVDDGSTDSSVTICEEYAKENANITVVCKENGGASSARNMGFKKVKGDYVYFLDSDDYLEENALQDMLECLVAEQADVIFFNAYAIEETTGNKTEKYYSYKKKYESGEGLEVLQELLLNKDLHVAPWIMLFDRSFLEREKITFEEGIIYEDMIFAYQVFCQAKKVTHLSKYLYNRRYRENSVMTTKISRRNFDSAEKVYYKVKEYSETISDKTKTSSYIAKCAYNALNVYRKLEKEDQVKTKRAYRELKADILQNKAYGDKALQMCCYGKSLWFVYKVFEKMISKVK